MIKKESHEEDTDIIFEDGSEEALQATIKKLKEKLKQCENEKKEYLEGWQKSRADLINLRKQDEETISKIRTYASEDILVDIITTLDSFEMAFSNKESWENVAKEWRVGVEYIYNQLINTLNTHGLTEINPKNQVFDPQKHEAVEILEGKDNIVIEVIQKGYELGDKVLRVAKVTVGKEQ